MALPLYQRIQLPLLFPPQELRGEGAALSERAAPIVEFLAGNRASFFAPINAGTVRGFPGETRDALWELVWCGWITNDTFNQLAIFCTNEKQKMTGEETFTVSFQSRLILFADCGHDQVVVRSNYDGRGRVNP